MKRALLVGIDDYPGTGSDLSSCVNDIAAWRSILMERFGFFRNNIRLLANDRARKDAVDTRLRWLTSGAKDGDTLVFVYSGHGTTFTHRDDNGVLDEEKDEALCLYGDRFDDLLVDDDLSQYFSNVSSGVNITVICDSCFSGGMDKAFLINTELAELPKFKYLQPPPDIAHRSDPFAQVRVFGYGLSKDKKKNPTKSDDLSPSRSLLLAACREIETAAADRPETEGLSVFSFFAIRALRSGNSPWTPRDLIFRVAQDIANAGHPQIPQFKGNENLFKIPLFTGGKIKVKGKKKEKETAKRKKA